MKTLARDFVGGYYLTSPEDPGLLRGVRYVHAYPCGMVSGKSFTYIKFSPGEMPDTQGDHQEMFDLSGVGADKAAADLFPLIMSEQPDLSQFTPSAREKVLASIAEGLSVFDALMTHIARLLPEYCGQTFAEAVEFRPELLTMIQHTDEETGTVSETPNIQRCSDER